MSLTDFVKLKHVQEKFNTEFKLLLKIKWKRKYYSNSGKEDNIRKENIGLHFGIFEGKVNLICDSYGRKKRISCFEDLTRFFTYSKYSNNLCWFTDASFNFEPILKHLPEQQLEDLEKLGKIEYYAHLIEYEEKKYFQVKNKKIHQVYKFYNLFPFFDSSLYDAAIKYLNYQKADSLDLDTFNDDINYWNKNYDCIVDYCIENAKIIQNLANYYVENNTGTDLTTRKKIINPPQTTNYSTIGTAFDYLFRFLIKAHNPSAISRPWIAHESLNLLKGREKKKAACIINDAEERYYRFLREKEINDDLISSTLLLAKLDMVYRINVRLEEMDMDVDPEDIADLRNLIKGVPKELYIAKKICFLNPTFGLASLLVGGADADLLLDNTLIDIKTTKDPKFSYLYFNQLMGYVLLHYLGLIYSNNIKKVDAGDEEDLEKDFLNTRIEKIGIYFSRFNHLHTIDLMDVLPDGKIDWKLLAWFEREAHKEFQPFAIKKYFKKSLERKLTFNDITLDELLHPNL